MSVEPCSLLCTDLHVQDKECDEVYMFVLAFKSVLWKGSLLPWHTGNQHEKKANRF